MEMIGTFTLVPTTEPQKQMNKPNKEMKKMPTMSGSMVMISITKENP